MFLSRYKHYFVGLNSISLQDQYSFAEINILLEGKNSVSGINICCRHNYFVAGINIPLQV